MPQVGRTNPLQASHFGTKVGVASGKILGAMVALPVVPVAGAHAARRSAAFFEQADLEARVLQHGCTGKARHAGADYGQVSDRIHGGHRGDPSSGCRGTWNSPVKQSRKLLPCIATAVHFMLRNSRTVRTKPITNRMKTATPETRRSMCIIAFSPAVRPA